jgi:hypothetical protein
MDTTMSLGDAHYIKTHVDDLARLPLEGTFTARDIPISKQRLSALTEKSVIEAVGERIVERPENGSYRRLTEWRVTDAARERIAQQLANDRPEELPCGHSGWRNERGVDGLSCKTCDRVYPKAVVRGGGGE